MDNIFQVDAFANEPFKGNPAGVVLLSEEKVSEWMQNFAKEMNLSETAFLLKEGDGYHLRWFTPAVEVDLCGHATLACGHVLFSEGLADLTDTIIFNSASGILKAKYKEDWVELDFPVFDVNKVPVTREIESALGFLPSSAYETDVNLLVEMNNLAEVREFQPDFIKLAELPYQGVIVTCQMKEGEFDFASRYFAPQAGINEDPVTGSAHCSLAPFWSEKLNKKEFLAYQASERGGILKVSLVENRTFLSGQAITIFSGNLRV